MGSSDLQQVPQHPVKQTRIEPRWTVYLSLLSRCNCDTMRGQGLARLFHRLIEQRACMMGHCMHLHNIGIDLGHLDSIPNKRIEARSFLVDN